MEIKMGEWLYKGGARTLLYTLETAFNDHYKKHVQVDI